MTRERRAYQRFRCSLPVFLQSGSGDELALRTIEISIGGMRIEIDKVLLRELSAVQINTTPADQVVLNARLSLSPSGNEDAWLSLKAHVVGVTRLAENRFALHVSFYGRSADQTAALSELVARLVVKPKMKL